MSTIANVLLAQEEFVGSWKFFGSLLCIRNLIERWCEKKLTPIVLQKCDVQIHISPELQFSICSIQFPKFCNSRERFDYKNSHFDLRLKSVTIKKFQEVLWSMINFHLIRLHKNILDLFHQSSKRNLSCCDELLARKNLNSFLASASW